MQVHALLVGKPKIITDRKGDGASTTLLDTSFTYDVVDVAGLNAVKLRLHLDRTDWTSITVVVFDDSTTEMVGASPVPILTVRQNANAGTSANAAVATGPTAGGFTGATGTTHVWISTDVLDDVLFLALGGTVERLKVAVKRTGGNAVAGNRVQIEATRVEG